MEQQLKIFKSVRAAYRSLAELGAPPHLIQHVKLVGEAAEMLIVQFQQLDLEFDSDWIRLGVVFHDTGKILHPTEFVEKGNRHELAGEILLLEQGIDPKIARCCRSHGQWQQLECSFEELVIALADNLWKGKRNRELEDRVIAKVAQMLSKDYWDVFGCLDDRFEEIAANGDLRLARSLIAIV
jgi:CRISPR/Cas system-associated endonuclease Cas3-HD